MPNKQSRLMWGVLCIAVVCGAAFTHESAYAKAPRKKFSYARIFYFQEGAHARASFMAHLAAVDILAPHTYVMSASGTLQGGVAEDVLSAAALHHINVMPLVTNNGFKRADTEAFLDDAAAQDAAAASLAQEAAAHNYWGWQIDFEVMDVSYRDKFSAFVEKCARALHAQGRTLSVAVVSQTSQNPVDYPPHSWQYIAGVYDYAALAHAADFLSIMAYDDSGSHASPARADWVKKVLAYALAQVPHEKISLGVPLYYWEWDAAGKRVGIGGYERVVAAMARHAHARGFNDALGAAFVRYRMKRVRYTIWYENARSMKQDVALIKKFQLHGFSAWALGLESPDIFVAVGKR